jgi:DivIVA domain-containing protein
VTWSVLMAALTVAVLVAGAWWLGRTRPSGTGAADEPGTAERGSASEALGFTLSFRGYRPDQVDEVLDRLEARVAAHDARIAVLEGRAPDPAAPSSGPRTADRPHPGPAAPATEPAGEPPPPDAGPAAGEGADPVAGRPAPLRLADLLAPLAYLAFSVYVHQHLLGAVRTGYLSQGVQDQQVFEWYFGAAAHDVATWSNPLFSVLQNYPDGVNLMANAAVLGLGVPLAPLTLSAGPQVTFLVVQLLGLALTATAWYWLFRRRLPVHPALAFVGAAFAGFAPGLVSHANGHPNFVVQALVPLVVDRMLRLAEGRRPVRDGVVLGLLVGWQVLIGEEVLLLTAVGMAVGGAVLLAHRRVAWRPLLRGVGTGALVALVLVGFPLWWQFWGPQSYVTIWHPPAGNDLAQLWSRATRSVGADPWAAAALSMNRTEENSFFGVPLWVATGATVLALRREATVRALAAVVVVSCWLSLGEEVTLHGSALGIPGPWVLLEHVPVVQNVLPTRFALVAVPALGALLALGADALRRGVDAYARVGGPGLALALAGAALVLLPVVPTPLVVDPRPEVPAFFRDGTWRDHVDDGGSVLAAPPPSVADARALEWQAEARWGFPLVGGYFVGPDGTPERGGQYGAAWTPLTTWLFDVATEDSASLPDPDQVATFEGDLRAARVDAVVLPVDRPSVGSLLASLTAAFGSPDQVGGVYVWDVREVTGDPG